MQRRKKVRLGGVLADRRGQGRAQKCQTILNQKSVSAGAMAETLWRFRRPRYSGDRCHAPSDDKINIQLSIFPDPCAFPERPDLRSGEQDESERARLDAWEYQNPSGSLATRSTHALR